MGIKAFIDGSHGTTGLELRSRLVAHSGVELMELPEASRKDSAARRVMLNDADVAFLCLPDAAATEAVSMAGSGKTRIIDASTAHRTNPLWAYGLPELAPGQAEKIAAARFVSVPGCYATCFALIVRPLVELGVIAPDYPLAVSAVSGYSGAGREAVARYEDPARKDRLSASLYYALNLKHKHIPEMALHAGLAYPPAFNPIICDFRKGMAMTVPVFTRLMKKPLSPESVHGLLAERYAGKRFVHVLPHEPGAGLDDGQLNPMACNGTNMAELLVAGNEEQVCVVCRLDNLGKGSSGAAVQCMNLMFGFDEAAGLN